MNNYKKINVILISLAVVISIVLLSSLVVISRRKMAKQATTTTAPVQVGGQPFQPTGVKVTPGGTSPVPPKHPQLLLEGYYVNKAQTFWIQTLGWTIERNTNADYLISQNKQLALRIEELDNTNNLSLKDYAATIITDPQVNYQDIPLKSPAIQTSVYKGTSKEGITMDMVSAYVYSPDKKKIYAFTMEIKKPEEQINALGVFRQQLGSFGLNM